MEVDVNKCLLDLIRVHLRNRSCLAGSNSSVVRRMKRKCYEILLSHRSSETNDHESWGSSFDHLHALSYDLKSRMNVDRLNSLIDVLWQSDCAELRSVMTLIVNLAFWNDNCEWSTTKSVTTTINAELGKNRFRGKISKWFEMPSLHPEIEKSSGSFLPSYNLFERCAPSLLLPDSLEIPELSEDLEEQARRFPRLCLKVSSGQTTPSNGKLSAFDRVDVDEGFEETVTPSSGISFHQTTLDDVSLWDIVSKKGYTCEQRPRTWECLRSLEPPLERPLLTEAGPDVVDHIVQCHFGDLSVVCPENVDQHRRTTIKVETTFVVTCILNVLISVPSIVFTYDKECHNFVVESVIVSGYSPTALQNLLKGFASCGSHHRRLEEAVELVSKDVRSGLVLRALSEGIRRYLHVVRVVVTTLHGRSDIYRSGRLIRLQEETAQLQRLASSVAELLNVSVGWDIDRLPTGFNLLQRIYRAVIDSLFNPVFISLFKWSLQPYLTFLQDWAFEGRNVDRHGEFPIRPNLELIFNIKDENWWNEGYSLDKMDDPILGSTLLSQVYVCGKSILVLRQCCPLHPLFSLTRERPRFTLGLSDSAIRDIELQWKLYFNEIESQLKQSKRLGSISSDLCSSLSLNEQTVPELRAIEIVEGVSETSDPEIEKCTANEFDAEVNRSLVIEEETTYTALPYNVTWPHLSESPMVDIAERVLNLKRPAPLMSEFNGLVLPAMIERCIAQPLISQVALVDGVALRYILHDMKLQKHFHFYASHFFMQDGEFSQSLCDLLYANLMSIERPTQLLNRMTLNSILDEACAQSIGRRDGSLTDFRAKLSFSVKYVPSNFRKRSAALLECLRLTHRVDWPITIVITAEAHKHYQLIFNFLLQLRLCLCSLSDIYHILKTTDPSTSSDCDVTTKSRYRQLQFYRQDMLYFIRSVHEHLNLMAFQRSFRKFQDDLQRIKSIDDLIASHNEYLKKVAFRCLLTKVAAPLMKILKDVFASVLDFRRWLVTGSEDRERKWDDEDTFARLAKTHDEFKQHSTLLAKAWLEKHNSRNYDGTKELPTTLCKFLDAVARL